MLLDDTLDIIFMEQLLYNSALYSQLVIFLCDRNLTQWQRFVTWIAQWDIHWHCCIYD